MIAASGGLFWRSLFTAAHAHYLVEAGREPDAA